MKVLFKYVKKQAFIYTIAISAMLISVCLDLLTPLLSRSLVDDVILDEKLDLLKGLLIGLLIIGVGRFIFQYVKEYLFDKAGSEVACSIRKDIFNHIQGLSADFFEKNNTGELMARVKDDVDRIWDGTTYVSMLIIEIIIHVVLIIVFMLRLNPLLTIIPVIGMIISGIVAVTMEKKLGTVYESISEENANLNRVAEENLTGVRTVKAFAREKHEISKFLSHNDRYAQLNIERSNVFLKYYPFLQVMSKILPLLVVLVGGAMVIYGSLTLGTLSAFIGYSFNIVWPMEMIGWLSNSMSEARASAKKLAVIYAVKPSITDSVDPIHLPYIKGDIAFSHVDFSKEDGYSILSDICFSIPAGKTLGIMGATGAGKTSITHLLQRFYDPTNGTILIDGVDSKKLTLRQLRKNIAQVMQEVFLFSDTISENVKMGAKYTIDSSAVRMAADNAEASSFIENLSEQYDTIIGERGVGLSGGQKQRLSIARALSKDAPILILDDSTSALDMETEREIWQKLHAIKNVTKIIIAHRISAVSKADEILYLEDGKIAERGTHISLLAQKGLYYETFMAQYGTIPQELEVS